ncbi:12647_t:CDS:2, partial [Entrophospora sp. SA101]
MLLLSLEEEKSNLENRELSKNELSGVKELGPRDCILVVVDDNVGCEALKFIGATRGCRNILVGSGGVVEVEDTVDFDK